MFHIDTTARFMEVFRIIIFRQEALGQHRLWVLLLHSFLLHVDHSLFVGHCAEALQESTGKRRAKGCKPR